MNKKHIFPSLAFSLVLLSSLSLWGCFANEKSDAQDDAVQVVEVSDTQKSEEAEEEKQNENAAEEAYAKLNISTDFRESFVHGPKPAENQKYIVLHDTEGDSDGASVVDFWDGNGNLIAAHFVVNKDGSIVQCVDLDSIAHHSGFGDTGHNDLFGVPEDGRDDRAGTTPIGDWANDYGMNSWSIGIEMVHVGDAEYPEAQLEAVDNLIAYIDAYYGFESEITDHKAWRTGNSDTSATFAQYLANYQDHRTHL